LFSQTVSDLFAMSVLIALGFLLAVAFYESLSTRDVLLRRTMRIARRSSSRRWLIGMVYAATVFLGIPILVVAWTVILEIGLVFVGSLDRLGNVSAIAVAVVAAARILAYIRERTSHELAKAIPLALAFVLLTGGTMRFEENLTRIVERPDGQALTEEMILFVVFLEIGLRLVTDGSHVVLGAIRSRRGIDSDLGVWRTLAAAVRSPLSSMAVDEPERQ